MTSAVALPVLSGCGEGSLEQLLSSLSLLENVVSEVFSSINGRVVEEQKRLASIGDRIEVQQKKIQKLATSTHQAVCVHSPFHYPAPAHIELVAPLFDTSDRKDLLPKMEGKIMKFPSSSSEPLSLATEVGLSFGESNYKTKGRQSTRRMGSVKSCADLVLFNSSASPYLSAEKETSNLDRLMYSSAKKLEELATSKKESPMSLPPPPPSIQFGVKLEYEELDRPRYKPKGSRLTMSFPFNLPQLANVASNVVCDEIPNFLDEDFFPSEFDVPSLQSMEESQPQQQASSFFTSESEGEASLLLPSPSLELPVFNNRQEEEEKGEDDLHQEQQPPLQPRHVSIPIPPPQPSMTTQTRVQDVALVPVPIPPPQPDPSSTQLDDESALRQTRSAEEDTPLELRINEARGRLRHDGSNVVVVVAEAKEEESGEKEEEKELNLPEWGEGEEEEEEDEKEEEGERNDDVEDLTAVDIQSLIRTKLFNMRKFLQ